MAQRTPVQPKRTRGGRRAHYLALGLAVCEIAGSGAALAQTAAAPATPAAGQSAPAKVQSVTVTGARETNRIDRQVYDNNSDIANANGTAADALNNVPSVSVDPDGSVSLRGNTNVQILVDGKPSAMLQGEGRGQILQAMPSEDIDSIEVINNPGAEFGNEGGGGPILNLVMRRSRRPGGLGSVTANYGSGGRYNAGANGQYNTGRFGLQGGINLRHDGRDSTSESDRERIDPRTGSVQRNVQTGSSTGLNDMLNLRGQLSYNLGQDDTLEANAFYVKRNNDNLGLGHYSVATDGVPYSDYLRTQKTTGENTNANWGARWDHKGEKLGELFRMDLRVSRTDNSRDVDAADHYMVVPPRPIDPASPFSGPDLASLQDTATKVRIVDYTGDYERPLNSGATLKLGYKLVDTDSRFDNGYYNIVPSSGLAVANAVRTNAYEVDERDAALYGSYQWKLSPRWGALVGMRTEYTHMDLDQVTSGVNAVNSYLNWIPSAFATYKLNDTTNLRFAYAHRIRRAVGNQLNPFVVYVDEFNDTSGNPRLKPVQTDSFEVGYETKFGKLDSNIRAYYRNDRDMIRSRQYTVSDNVLLTTFENGGSNRAGGLEFTLSGKVTPKLTINTSGNLAFTEQQQIDITGAEVKRTASSLSVRGRAVYALTDKDQLQVTLNAQGKTLVGTGYREPTATMNLSWHRAITPTLNLLLTVNDIFASQKNETITDTEYLKQRSITRWNGRTAFVGLQWRFGGVQGGGMRQRGDGPGREGGGWGGPPPGGPGAGPGGGPGM